MRRFVGRWARYSQRGALANAREASVVMCRARVEREEVELYLASHRRPHRRFTA